MLPPLQINQIIDRGGDDLTFLSDEVLTTESTPSETLKKKIEKLMMVTSKLHNLAPLLRRIPKVQQSILL